MDKPIGSYVSISIHHNHNINSEHMNEERLKELEAYKAKLEMQLNETAFLIEGYKNAIKNEDVQEAEVSE